MILALSKIYRIRANKLLKLAREGMTSERFSAGVSRFIPFFREFISAADEDQVVGLTEILKMIEDYSQLMISTAYAFDQKNWANAHNGFVNSTARADEISSQIEHLKSQDPEVLLYIEGNDEVDLADSIEDIINGGRSLVTDKFRQFFDEIEKARAADPSAFEDREVDNTPDVIDDENDRALIEREVGYRQEYDPSEGKLDTTVDAEHAALEGVNKEKNKAKKLRRQKRLYNLMTGVGQTDAETAAMRDKFRELIKKFKEAKSRWNNNYYLTHFKNSDKYEAAKVRNNINESRKRKNWYKYQAFTMKPEQLEELKKNPEEYAKVIERRDYMARLKLRNLEEFNSIIRDWQGATKRRKKDIITNDRAADRRRQKNLEDLLNKLNRGRY